MHKSNEQYIEHEVKIRLLDHLYKAMNYKLNAIITIIITGFAMPLVMKYFGG